MTAAFIRLLTLRCGLYLSSSIGNDLTVEFLTFIRPEKKFANFDELAKQIKKDIETAKEYHNI